MRRGVLKAMKDRAITFIEDGFQPHGPVFKEEPRSGLTAERLNRKQGMASSPRKASSKGLASVADIKTSPSVSSEDSSYTV